MPTMISRDIYMSKRIYNYVEANPLARYGMIANEFGISYYHAMMAVRWLRKLGCLQGYRPIKVIGPYTRYNKEVL